MVSWAVCGLFVNKHGAEDPNEAWGVPGRVFHPVIEVEWEGDGAGGGRLRQDLDQAYDRDRDQDPVSAQVRQRDRDQGLGREVHGVLLHGVGEGGGTIANE